MISLDGADTRQPAVAREDVLLVQTLVAKDRGGGDVQLLRCKRDNKEYIPPGHLARILHPGEDLHKAKNKVARSINSKGLTSRALAPDEAWVAALIGESRQMKLVGYEECMRYIKHVGGHITAGMEAGFAAQDAAAVAAAFGTTAQFAKAMATPIRKAAPKRKRAPDAGAASGSKEREPATAVAEVGVGDFLNPKWCNMIDADPVAFYSLTAHTFKMDKKQATEFIIAMWPRQ